MDAVEARRKVARDEIQPGCPVHQGKDGVWRVQDFAGAREFLRLSGTRQAGFKAESARNNPHVRPPVLYRDGEEHNEHRRQTARYFTPKRVDTAYRDLMNRYADEQCDALRRRGEADLADLSFGMAVSTVGEVLGLTEAGPGMARRLENFFREGTGLYHRLRTALNIMAFFRKDVKPSIEARRTDRRDDLISHLIDDGCTDRDILGECVTFGAAGMSTTREFIVLAAWQLFDDPALRERFLTAGTPDHQAAAGEPDRETAAGEAERRAILHEILRLDPVISNLLRTTDVPISVGGALIPAGSRVDVGVAAINVDSATVGENAGGICPARPLAEGVPDSILSFGDGPHRCPGAYIAIQETDIFLTKLFAMPGLEMVSTPKVRNRPEVQSWELRGLRVRVKP
jgi:cytochrome P450